jgi:hypothetical protein
MCRAEKKAEKAAAKKAEKEKAAWESGGKKVRHVICRPFSPAISHMMIDLSRH